MSESRLNQAQSRDATVLRTVLAVLVPQGVRRRSAGAPVPRSGDAARIREMIADAGRYLILRGRDRGCGVVLVSHCRLRQEPGTGVCKTSLASLRTPGDATILISFHPPRFYRRKNGEPVASRARKCAHLGVALTLRISLRIRGSLLRVEERLCEGIILDLQARYFLVLVRRHRDKLGLGEAICENLCG